MLNTDISAQRYALNSHTKSKQKPQSLTALKNNTQGISFGRALTTEEKAQFQAAMLKAMEKLETNSFAAIVFDQSFPATSNARDTGVGSSFSESAQNVAKFMTEILGVNKLQLGPQGTISPGNTSPYSGSVYAYNNLAIDLDRLSQPSYGSVLAQEDIEIASQAHQKSGKSADMANYETAFDTHQYALATAFYNFNQLDESSPIVKEYQAFIAKNDTSWLDKDAVYEALTYEYPITQKDGPDKGKPIIQNGKHIPCDDFNRWGLNNSNGNNVELDKNLYNPKVQLAGKEARIEELKEKTTTIGDYELEIAQFHKFCQFLAAKQQKESRQSFNDIDIKIAGDCLIGFSPREHWANQEAFLDNRYLGCQKTQTEVATWGLAALNLQDLDGKAGEVLRGKLDNFFEKYDGARIDAAWQLVKPYLYSVEGVDKEGNTTNAQYQGRMEIGKRVYEMIVDSARKAAETKGQPFDKRDINMEILGMGDLGNATDLAKEMGLPQLMITRYAKDNDREKWSTANLLRGKLGEDGFVLLPGTHDDVSLIELSEQDKYAGDKGKQVDYLQRDLNTGSWSMNIGGNTADFRKAKFAELFTAKNSGATMYDMFGVDKTFNDQFAPNDANTAGGRNWKLRLPQNFEQMYFENVKNGKGLNLPNALKLALRARGREDGQLTSVLQKFEQILGESGPMTTAEADSLKAKGQLGSKVNITVDDIKSLGVNQARVNDRLEKLDLPKINLNG